MGVGVAVLLQDRIPKEICTLVSLERDISEYKGGKGREGDPHRLVPPEHLAALMVPRVLSGGQGSLSSLHSGPWLALPLLRVSVLTPNLHVTAREASLL